jgi:hypothetical protein
MFGNQLMQAPSSQGQQNAGYATANVTTLNSTPGAPNVRSSMDALNDQIAETQVLAENMRTALGISVPQEAGEGKAPANDLATIIAMMAKRLSIANQFLRDSLYHING